MSFLVDTRERPPIGVDAQPIAQYPDTGLIESQMRLLTSNEVLRVRSTINSCVSTRNLRRADPWELARRIKALLGIAPPKADKAITISLNRWGEPSPPSVMKKAMS